MSTGKQEVALGEVLRKTSDRVIIDSIKAYAEITVKLNGKGVVPRKEVAGATIADERRLVARAGQLILSRIDARNGAIGIVPPELDGAIVSNDFPCFSIDSERVHSTYLHWVLQAPSFVGQLSAASAGTTNRVRLDVDEFLGLRVPLPTIEEQRRLALVLSEVANRVVRLAELRQTSQEVCRAVLRRSIAERMSALAPNYPTRRLGDFLSRRREQIELAPGVEYAGVGTRMWGLGTYIHERRDGGSFEAERYGVLKGQVIYNEVWAHHGAIGVVGDLEGNLVVSRHFHVFDLDRTIMSDEFLQRFFQSEGFWTACREGSVGTTGRGHMRRDHLMRIEIPAPPLVEQEAVAQMLSGLDRKLLAVRELQWQTSEEVDALLPAVLDKAFRGEM